MFPSITYFILFMPFILSFTVQNRLWSANKRGCKHGRPQSLRQAVDLSSDRRAQGLGKLYIIS
jgi:hypothetical protein